MLERDRPILIGLSVKLLLGKRVEFSLRHRSNFSNDDIIAGHLGAGANDAILIKLVISAVLAARGLRWVRDGEFFSWWLQNFLVGTVEDRSEETAIDCRLIQHDGIFLIVT